MVAVACLLLAGCGSQRDDTSPDGGGGEYALTLIGSQSLQLHPGERRRLQVVLAQDQVGPVANAVLHFEFQDGDSAGATLESGNDVTSDANGIATVLVAAGTSVSSRPAFKLVATAPAYDAAPVAFSLSLIPVRLLLQIVGAPGTTVIDGQNATVSMYTASTYRLQVREIDQDTFAPIAGDTLHFTLPNVVKARWSGTTDDSITVVTAAGGEAQALLVSDELVEAPFLVVGQSAASGAAVNFKVTVQAWSTATCGPDQRCQPGQSCVDGQCQDGGGNSCDADNPCLSGFQCLGGACQPPPHPACDPGSPDSCGSGQCCDSTSTCKDLCPTPCKAQETCVPGAACGTGSCQPTQPSTPDVSGVWTTRHIFNIRDALPRGVRTLFDALRYLDQALLGKLAVTGTPWVDRLVNRTLGPILRNYLPEWLQTILRLGDDLGVVLSHLRSEGSMRITNGVDLAHVRGSEVWTSLIFYWLPLCGDDIGGDVDVPPACARVDLVTTDGQTPSDNGQCKGHGLPSIAVQVTPFTAHVTGNADAARIDIDRRQVGLKMGKVILIIVDSILALATPYHCIDEATDCQKGQPCLVDCPQLGADLSRLTGGVIRAGGGEQICDAVVGAVGRTTTELLASAWPINADLLDFSGHATVTAGGDASSCASGRSCAERLGDDSFERDLARNVNARNGFWEGDFFFKRIGKLPGAFEAQRPAP